MPTDKEIKDLKLVNKIMAVIRRSFMNTKYSDLLLVEAKILKILEENNNAG